MYDNELALSARREQVSSQANEGSEDRKKSEQGGGVVKVVLAGYF